MKKIKKNYRFSSFVISELKNIVKELNITETSFVEMAIIEKIERIKNDKVNKGEIKYFNQK